MTAIKSRICLFCRQILEVLNTTRRQHRGEDLRSRVVDQVAPGVGSCHLQAAGKSAIELSRERVVVRVSVGKESDHWIAVNPALKYTGRTFEASINLVEVSTSGHQAEPESAAPGRSGATRPGANLVLNVDSVLRQQVNTTRPEVPQFQLTSHAAN